MRRSQDATCAKVRAGARLGHENGGGGRQVLRTILSQALSQTPLLLLLLLRNLRSDWWRTPQTAALAFSQSEGAFKPSSTSSLVVSTCVLTALAVFVGGGSPRGAVPDKSAHDGRP